MAKYVIEAPHTPEECLTTMDEALAQGTDFLAKFQWGCKSGVHQGWAVVEGESASAVRDTLPASQRNKWRVTEVAKFTPEQIAAYHQAQA